MPTIRSVVPAVIAAALAGAAIAAPFKPGNLVVIRVDNTFPSGTGAIYLDEYNLASLSAPINTVALPAAGSSAMCAMTLGGSHENHLHRSVDGQFLTLTGYSAVPSDAARLLDPSATIPRVVALVRFNGAIDVSTRLTDAFDVTSIRGAITTTGTSLWLSGDNAGGGGVDAGGNSTGGLRYTTKGASTSVNLSEHQVATDINTPDNIRDVNIFGLQLYDCSGSNASVGKGAFKVGSGLPISGSQSLTPLFTDTLTSTTSFYFLDATAAVPGVDTLYTAASANGDGVHKYSLVGGVWVARGYYPFNGVDHVVARLNSNGTATVFASNVDQVVMLTDSDPVNSDFTANPPASTTLLLPPSGFIFGGLDFSPVCAADFNQSGAVTVQDLFDFLSSWFAKAKKSDFNLSGSVTVQDLFDFLGAWFAKCQ